MPPSPTSQNDSDIRVEHLSAEGNVLQSMDHSQLPGSTSPLIIPSSSGTQAGGHGTGSEIVISPLTDAVTDRNSPTVNQGRAATASGASAAAPGLTRKGLSASTNTGTATSQIYSEAPSRRLTPEASEALDGQYHGPSSAQSFLGRAFRRLDRNNPRSLLGAHQYEETDTAILSYGDCKTVEPDVSNFSWPEFGTATTLLHRYFEFSSPTYRFMHEPTMHQWLPKIYSRYSEVPNAVAALLLLMFASASVVQVDPLGNTVGADHLGWQASEVFFTKSQQLLNEEAGPPRLESVQARFASVQYYLASSRPNKALFTFGSVVQLLHAIGLHRKRRPGIARPDAIVAECHKRMFWCAFTLDKYLSIVMGRPPLLHLEDTNQELPIAVNDDELDTNGTSRETPRMRRDCLLNATISHAKLAIILAKALKEQHRLPGTADCSHVEAAVTRSEEIKAWHSGLTPLLSGAIQSSSLIPSFRRQHGVLALARLHATMLTTRSLLLRDLSHDLPSEQAMQYKDQLQSCVMAAREAIETITIFAQEKQLLPAFWYSQYIAFNAISIIYIYLIQHIRRLIPDDLFHASLVMDNKSLFELAHTGQLHLAEASVKNAPAWRYSLILEGLCVETRRHLAVEAVPGQGSTDASLQIPPNGDPSSLITDQHQGGMDRSLVPPHEMIPLWGDGHESMFDDLIAENIDNNLTMEFWPFFDNLPINV